MKESKALEFKQALTNSFLKTVSAYANFGTGKILFGVTDAGDICGIDNLVQARLDIENKINDSISPKPNYSLSVNEKTKVITLTVEEGLFKPYFYKGKAYRRSDTSSVEVDSVELTRLALEGSNLSFEALASSDQTLTFDVLERKLIEKVGISHLSNDMLRTFGFYAEKDRFNNAAALFADHNSFPGIDVARFGNSINEILDRETFSGISILSQYERLIEFYRRYFQYEKIEGFERVKTDLIPEAAVREAIANALVHRTWDVGAHIKVEIYQDRLEIISPGGLPSGLSEDEYIKGNISNLRNPTIGNLFFRMHYIEMFGTGIRRIIESYSSCVKKPSFEIFDNSIKVILPTVSFTALVTTDGQKVLDVLRSGMQLSGREIATTLGWSKDKAIRTINTLKESGYINTVGNGRSTKYSKK